MSEIGYDDFLNNDEWNNYIDVINDLDQTYWMGTAVVQFTLGHFLEIREIGLLV